MMCERMEECDDPSTLPRDDNDTKSLCVRGVMLVRVCAVNDIKAEGAQHLTEALKVNTSVTSINLGGACLHDLLVVCRCSENAYDV